MKTVKRLYDITKLLIEIEHWGITINGDKNVTNHNPLSPMAMPMMAPMVHPITIGARHWWSPLVTIGAIWWSIGDQWPQRLLWRVFWQWISNVYNGYLMATMVIHWQKWCYWRQWCQWIANSAIGANDNNGENGDSGDSGVNSNNGANPNPNPSHCRWWRHCHHWSPMDHHCHHWITTKSPLTPSSPMAPLLLMAILVVTSPLLPFKWHQ